ncbi:Spx/MgsR family RNA polymerase-binding regulatory protein [Prochlorococcus marinus]|uniref:Spx/MgsR family RNA polymerase-binding regulatory protein n=1 Tax=Prochlorococcus marinus TaxID=1219 RepID=UPI0022B4821D|nr:Spx/MgsR family RNA polymerase-binding regulatory protein [Prochlorococcus marinus]
MANQVLIKVYSYSLCGSCKKALSWLSQNGIAYEIIDIIKCPPPSSLIKEGVKQLGDRKYLLNTSGKSYRNIGAQLIKRMKDSEVIELLSKDSKLIKRPFVVNTNGEIIVGFNESKWESFFLN